MNFLAPGGSSIPHPHFQIQARSVPYSRLALARRASAEHLARTGRSYWGELVEEEARLGARHVGETGPVRWLAAWAPGHQREIWGVLPGASSLAEVGEEEARAFAEGISRVATFYERVGSHAFTLAFWSSPAQDDACTSRVRLSDDELWADRARLVRSHREIPTRHLYRREGRFSPGVFERHFGPWSSLPEKFRAFTENKPDRADVVALLPAQPPQRTEAGPGTFVPLREAATPARGRHARRDDRPTYGDPLDFRGLRHAPVNEQGVVFLFSMVARELGYMVEEVQTGFPDWEAKRQVGTGQWQRVRIEFEYESRNFREHGHAVDGCDVIVCWRHNWPECPFTLEVVELSTVMDSLAPSDD